jgi:hypothetical protein
MKLLIALLIAVPGIPSLSQAGIGLAGLHGTFTINSLVPGRNHHEIDSQTSRSMPSRSDSANSKALSLRRTPSSKTPFRVTAR